MNIKYYKRCLISLLIGIIQLLYIVLILIKNDSKAIMIYKDLGFFQTFHDFFSNTQTVLSLYYSLIFIVIQVFCFGTYIYSDLQISSVYYFSRNANIKKWYVIKILHLHILIIAFCTLYICLFSFLIHSLTKTEHINILLIFTFKQIVLSMAYTYFLCILTNVMATIFGAVKSILYTNMIDIFVVIMLYYLHSESSSVVLPVLYLNELPTFLYLFILFLLLGSSLATDTIGYHLIKKVILVYHQ